jgi:hypothetical protein
MPRIRAEPLRVYPVGRRRFVYTPPGRGEELRHHLASHGIEAFVSHVPGGASDRLELAGDVDVRRAQAVLDEWGKRQRPTASPEGNHLPRSGPPPGPQPRRPDGRE